MGKATVLGFADEGVKVVIADLDEGRGEATTKEVKDKGGKPFTLRLMWPTGTW
jgi:NAD(P)-dependent dehydrogenase (short-subunit alcohol dehydrogenase family)